MKEIYVAEWHNSQDTKDSHTWAKTLFTLVYKVRYCLESMEFCLWASLQPLGSSHEDRGAKNYGTEMPVL